MEVSRVLFTKETREKMGKGLNKRQRGKLRFEKLKEAFENGELQKAKTRADVARLVGFTSEQYKTGYSWVMNMLTRKHLIERISGLSKNGRAEYEYTLGTDPDYGMVNAAAARSKKPRPKEEGLAGKCQVWVDESPTVLASLKVVIRYKDLSMELENVDKDTAVAVISNLLSKVMKGE